MNVQELEQKYPGMIEAARLIVKELGELPPVELVQQKQPTNWAQLIHLVITAVVGIGVALGYFKIDAVHTTSKDAASAAEAAANVSVSNAKAIDDTKAAATDAAVKSDAAAMSAAAALVAAQKPILVGPKGKQ